MTFKDDICVILKPTRSCIRNLRFKVHNCMRKLWFQVRDFSKKKDLMYNCMRNVHFEALSEGLGPFSCSHVLQTAQFSCNNSLASKSIKKHF